MLEPRFEKHRSLVKAIAPHGSPSVPDDSRVRWTNAVAEHHATPANALPRVAPYQVAAVVVIAVDGRTDGDDCLQRLGLMGSGLEAGDPTPRDPHHPNSSGAPVLVGNPLNDLDGICLLAGRVFISHQAFGVAMATHVRSDTRITAGSEPGVIRVVTQGDPVAFAIRDELKDRGDRLVICPIREPELGRQAHAVGHRNPDVFYDPIGQCTTTARRRWLLFWYGPKLIRWLPAARRSGRFTGWGRVITRVNVVAVVRSPEAILPTWHKS